MSSSNSRSARDLRELVEASREDGKMEEFPDDMKANLDKLRALSKDDLTENAMLRSRIDQQAELICILKNRADESLRRAMSLEKEHSEMKRNYDESVNILHGETRKLQVLQRRFDTLCSNHEEMIKLKDEYKSSNNSLKLENEKLQRENKELFNSALVERQKIIDNLRNEQQKSQDEFTNMEKRYREVYAHLLSVEKESAQQINALQKTLDEAGQKFEVERKEMLTQNESMKKQIEDSGGKTTSLSKERDELAQLAMERGKKIQEKDHQIKTLLSRIGESEEAIKEMEDKFVKECESVSANATVRKLRAQVDEVEKQLLEQDREFAAYKKHSSMLLTKERELNSKLRALIG